MSPPRPDPVEVVVRAGGACRSDVLLAAGATRRHVTAAIGRRELLSVGPGAVAVPGASRDLVAAVSRRGALTCVSAVRFDGLPVLTPPDMPHLLSPRHRDGPGAVWHRGSRAAARVVGLAEAVAEVARCRAPGEALAVADAALRSGRVEPADLAGQLRTRERGHLRWVVRHADPRAESVLESALRALLIRGGVTGLDLQVPLAGVGRVDLLLGGWLVLEADGFADHGATRSDYREDRRRDAAAVAAGFVTLRFSWEAVLFDPDRVLASVRAAVSRRGRGTFRTAT